MFAGQRKQCALGKGGKGVRIRKLAQKWKTETIHFLSRARARHGPPGKFVYMLRGWKSFQNERPGACVGVSVGVCGLREKPR